MTEEQLDKAFAEEIRRASKESVKILEAMRVSRVDLSRSSLLPLCITLCATATAHGASDVELQALVSVAWGAVQESKNFLAEKAAETKTKN